MPDAGWHDTGESRHDNAIGPGASLPVAIIADERDVGRRLAADARSALGVTPAVLTYDQALADDRPRGGMVLVAADAAGIRWRSLAGRLCAQTHAVLAIADATIEDAADAMRLGMAGLLQLDRPRRDIARCLRGLAGDATRACVPPAAPARSAPAADMDLVTVRAEFAVLARLELDVESLLRTTLEYVLHKIGPTNATIFLPTAGRDFSLGAYVNYDCPRDSVDMLLDHMTATAAPWIEANPEHQRHRGESAIDRVLGEHGAWLTGCEAVTFACEHEGELLAAVALFRDDRDPYDDRTMRRLRVIGDILGRQLAKIVRIHHRNLPHDHWETPEERGEDPGLAA